MADDIFEARGFIGDVDNTRHLVEVRLNIGTYKSCYSFRDFIYAPQEEEVDLTTDFVRARVNEFPRRDVVLVRKRATWQGICKRDEIVLEREFRTLVEAEGCVRKEFSRYKRRFSYSRYGWEYSFSGCNVHVEEIEYLGPSVEVHASTLKELEETLRLLEVDKMFTTSVAEAVRRKIETD